MHYILIISIVAFIIFKQVKTYLDTKSKISEYRNVFPDSDEQYKLSGDKIKETIIKATDEELQQMIESAGLDPGTYIKHKWDEATETSVAVFRSIKAKNDLCKLASVDNNLIVTDHKNKSFTTILDAINQYLRNNKSVNDFHLLKDIVDRTNDIKEEEITTQIPIPLYFGLVGTMIGILVGLGFLVADGSLQALLSSTSSTGVSGVETLLGGVALAMLSSILGILLTTWGSNKFKEAKKIYKEREHVFLSWIQSRLLPTLSDNVAGAIREMGGNLMSFNKEFADNTSNLGTALAKVNESYKLQTDLIEAVNKIQEGNTAARNIQLLGKLVESSEQIGRIAEFIKDSTVYLEQVRALNEQLGQQEKRTQIMEDVGVFFKTELSEINNRKEQMGVAVAKLDDYMKEALDAFKVRMQQQFEDINVSIVKQHEILDSRTKEMSAIALELQNLKPLRDSFGRFEVALNYQNENLNKILKLLVEQGYGKNVIDPALNRDSKWKKIFVIYLCVILTMIPIVIILVSLDLFN